MSKNVMLTWELPTTREAGGALDPSEISGTALSMSANGGVDWVSLDTIPPTAVQEYAINSVPTGDHLFRFIVTDTAGVSSADLDFPVVVPDDSAPGTVVNVQVTLS